MARSSRAPRGIAVGSLRRVDRAPSGSSGFTLVEALIAIAVVSVLAAVTLPVFLAFRETARRVTCLANLRQIGLAFSLYLADSDGAFPNTGDPHLWMGRRWRWPLEPYLGGGLERDPVRGQDPLRSARSPGLLLCPSDHDARAAWDGTSYGYSAAFYHTPAQIAAMKTEDLYQASPFLPVTQRQSMVVHPSKKVLIAEWLTNHDRVKVGWWDWSGSRNYLFVDGHAAYLPARRLNPAGNGYPDPNLTVGGVTGRDID